MKYVLAQGIPVNLGVEWLVKAAVEQLREKNPTVCRRKVCLAVVSLLSDFGVDALDEELMSLFPGGSVNYLILVIPDCLTKSPEQFYQQMPQEFRAVLMVEMTEAMVDVMC